jgi:hypothetical protein
MSRKYGSAETSQDRPFIIEVVKVSEVAEPVDRRPICRSLTRFVEPTIFGELIRERPFRPRKRRLKTGERPAPVR